MGLKNSTTVNTAYKLPILKEPYKNRLDLLPQKYLQTELPLASKDSFMGLNLPMLSASEKVAQANAKGFSEDRIKAIKHIVSAKQPKALEINKQNKHIPGTNEFKQKELQNLKNKLKRPGIILFPANEAQKLVNSLHGTGVPVISRYGEFLNKEIVRSPYPVGVVDSGHGMVFTNYFTIHYSKKGTHIVPRYNENEK